MIKELIFNNSRWWKIESIASTHFNETGSMTIKWAQVTTNTCKRVSFLKNDEQPKISPNFNQWGIYGPSHGDYIGRAYVNFADIGKTEVILYHNNDDYLSTITMVRAEDAIVLQNGGGNSPL